jgi:hypothetical protein
MMKKSLVMSLVSVVVLVSQVNADNQVVWNTSKGSFQDDISIGAQLGGIAGVGLGLNVKYKIDDQFGVRAGFDMFSVSDVDVEDEEVDYKFDAKIQDFSMLIDWHPWCGSFRTSAGLIINSSELDGVLTPSSNLDFEIQGQKFYAKDIGSIDTLADFDPVAPYIGIGGDTSFAKDKGWGFTYDLGVIFQGAAKVNYTPHYTDLAPEYIKKDLNKQLEIEKKSLQDELDQYEILPYVSIGFNYKF